MAELKRHQNQFTGLISQQVFVASLKDKLNQSGVGQRFLAGRLNFCTLDAHAQRSIKACFSIIGLNEAAYPRQTIPMSFDLMNNMQIFVKVIALRRLR